ncbi:MAG TPA: hypothetical protein VGF55_12415 [Gemmataceae bacterium]|jgi:hypothetical protein
MSLAGRIVVFAAIVPLAAAVRANRSTSLIHATVWAVVAWAGWLAAATSEAAAASHVALVLTGCAGVAVLGARRPGAAAWNFVVLGLLVVLLLPLLEAAALNTPLHPGTFRTVFLAVLLGTTVMNYLPTRLAAAAVLLGVGCGWQLADVLGGRAGNEVAAGCVGLATWFGWLGWRATPNRESAGDRRWRDFRDRYGFVWGQRVRDQFNRAAVNAGLACELRWTGFHPQCGAAAQELLEALTKRFC